MELEPVVQIVQVDGVRQYGTVVGQSTGAKDALAGVVGVDVARDGHIQLVDRGAIQFDAGLLSDPGFKLGVGGLALGDELLDGVGVQSEGIQDHHVVASANAGITSGELAAGLEGDFDPETREMQDA